MAANDIYEVTLVAIINGQRAVNVQHFRETTASTDTLPAKSVCAAWEDVLLPLWQLMVSDEAALSCIYARRVKPTPHIPYQLVESSAPGSIDSHSVPSNAAGILTLYSTLASRSGRGRQYISGIPETRVSNGVMESTQIAAIADYADALMGPVAAPSPFDGVWTGVVYSPTLGTAADIIEYHINPSMGTMQSRRQPYGMTV